MANSSTKRFLAWALLAITAGCRPAVNVPPVNEPLDSQQWKKCAGELGDRESMGLIDDLTLDSKTLICKGITLANAGKTEEALEALTEAGVRDEKDHRPHYMAARILAEAGRYEEALSAYVRAQMRLESLEVPAERLGRTALEKKGAVEARRVLELASERDQCPFGCQSLLADLYRQTGEEDRARKVYERLIKENPAEPAPYIGLAALQNKASKFTEEARLLDKAISAKNFSKLSQSERAHVFYSLAFARYNLEQYGKAKDAIEKALRMEPKHADWQVLAGWIAMKRDDPSKALEAFEKAQRLDRKLAAAIIGQGDAFLALDSKGEARAAYEKARELAPNDAVLALKLADVLSAAGNLDAARSLIEEADGLDKNLPQDLLQKIKDRLKAPVNPGAASKASEASTSSNR